MAAIQTKLVERARNIILAPTSEWPAIDAEPATIGTIYKSYVLPLAAIPAAAALIGSLLFGYTMFGITIHPSVITAVGGAITQYILALITVFVLALIIDGLAPSFGGTRDRTQAFKVAAYSYTAAWLAGVLLILPQLWRISVLLSLYGFYLLYLGLPLLMRSAREKALAFTVVTVVATIRVFAIVGAITSAVARLFEPAPISIVDSTVAGTVAVPGGATIDLAQLGAAARQADIAAKGVQISDNGTVTAKASPSALLALLPETLGGYHRTETASSGVNAGGLGGAQAEARYENGDGNIRLGLTDMAAAGAIASLGGALDVQANRETASGYERTRTENGRMVSEKWDRPSREGSYSELIGNRFMVSAEGKVADISELKRAAAAVSPERLAALGR